ncbi:dolichol-phosphate mannosyltransferase [Cypionkella aquatica]|uniref:Dolichol-phosphate mannosyltransferase n=1 Tax=Cypionkella aquatica TaxID=1756042 RepID=A0AA37X3A7_9RHOB|nr:glycosyltransferase family 2 protein [Cypionkella aquatica]GLS88459.1 dolichol-phosphate mannosyltransferase [Cypionkella aquatica]
MTRISVVIPAKNEAENIVALVEGIDRALALLAPFEIIVVDDCSTDNSVAVLQARATTMPHLRIVRHDRSGGQSAAVQSGVKSATAPVICTLDGDGQNPPEELPKLVAPILNDTTGRIGLVAGQRVGRQDTWSKKWASKFANGLRGWILQDGTRDTGCGLKAFQRQAFLDLPYFDHMHRYLPALFNRDGWQVAHVDVSHRPRGAGRSNYSNIQRALVGIVDLAGVAWLLRRRKKARVLPDTVQGDAK